MSTAGATPGQFAYGSLPSPITLTAGNTYYVVSDEGNGDAWIDSTNTFLTATSAATMTGSVYRNGGLPDSPWAVGAWYSYGPVTLEYSSL